MEEKATMAQNLRDLLQNGRGCWITTDIIYKELQEKVSTALGPGVEKAVQFDIVTSVKAWILTPKA
jgi:hypothetical protein